ncbi:MAG: hypothetical protein J0H68_02490 [Sphingobacteriia bacterium]|nr:hypothetical protein [Sphingobacteriia bacterium]
MLEKLYNKIKSGSTQAANTAAKYSKETTMLALSGLITAANAQAQNSTEAPVALAPTAEEVEGTGIGVIITSILAGLGAVGSIIGLVLYKTNKCTKAPTADDVIEMINKGVIDGKTVYDAINTTREAIEKEQNASKKEMAV